VQGREMLKRVSKRQKVRGGISGYCKCCLMETENSTTIISRKI